jgi:tetrahedral aminopeptidase
MMNLELLRKLTSTRGIAGFEDSVRTVVEAELAPLVDDFRTDRLGNLIATKRGGSGGPTVLIAAHMDEIGFLVRFVDERGFLRLQHLGSFDPRVLLAQRVIVHTASGEIVRGTIETTNEPLHFGTPTVDWRPNILDLFVDVGAAANQVEIGDMVTLERDMHVTEDRIVGRALDDRLGVYAMIEAIRHLGDHTATIVAVATTQEEVGSRGAVVAGFDIDPDICIALDLTVANDIPGSAPDQEVTRLGQGPAVKIFDTTQISHRGIVRHIRDIAGELAIPLQLEVLNHGGTDASLIQRLRSGVNVATLSIPARYLHTVNETVAISDVEQCVALITCFLERSHL